VSIQARVRHFRYVEPAVSPDGSMSAMRTVTVSEEEILASVYAYWCHQMRLVGREDQISPEGCIEDWCCVHWAHEVKSWMEEDKS
jgi:hypothetical protein